VKTDLLGSPYEMHTIELGSDSEGPVTATLVRRPAESPNGTAVLYLHGFVDYFFQTHVADFFANRGNDFYALDLRKHGRSLLPHQTPNYCTDLTLYWQEINEAVRIIRSEGDRRRLILHGHSTGGLLAALWAHDRRDDGLVDALVLNSAFLDLNVAGLLRYVGTPLTTRIGRIRPNSKLPFALNPVHGMSIHRDHNGEWDYDLAWKPLAGFPVYAGWIRAIRQAQQRVHAGLEIQVPVLSLASTASYKGSVWDESARSADAVLDVEHIARWSANLGCLVTIARIEHGLHDLALSPEPVRQRYFAEVERWLRAYVP
jgi:alpha-beta hydrolase superfamily lysophospholipase